MNTQEFDQLKSYSTLIVAKLHEVIFDDHTYRRLKGVLKLAEEMEMQTMAMERKRQGETNVVRLRIA